MKRIVSTIALLLLASTAFAQIYNKDSAGRSSISLNIGSEESNDTSTKLFDVHIGVVDLGINSLNDKTDYNSAATQAFLQVPTNQKNSNLFALREGKSWNVNVYPVLLKARLVKTQKQRVYASIGIGVQMYNFRYSKPISLINETTPTVIIDSVAFSKNKLAVTYLSIPLMATMKTKLAKDIWLVYGLGITAGYRISSLTKQISGPRGKQKNHDAFNLNDFNTCVTGELGLDGYVRLFASYQLTSLFNNGLEQYPFAIGFRLVGI